MAKYFNKKWTRLREIHSWPFIPDDGRALAVVEGDATRHAPHPLAGVAGPPCRQARRSAVPVIKIYSNKKGLQEKLCLPLACPYPCHRYVANRQTKVIFPLWIMPTILMYLIYAVFRVSSAEKACQWRRGNSKK